MSKIKPLGFKKTLFVADDASGVNDAYYAKASRWCHYTLVIGAPWPCKNFFVDPMDQEVEEQDNEITR